MGKFKLRRCFGMSTLNLPKSATSGLEILYSSPPYVMFRVTTPEVAYQLSDGANWPHKKHYFYTRLLKWGPLYMLYRESRPYVQYSLDCDEFVLSNGEEISDSTILEIVEILEKANLLDVKAKIKFRRVISASDLALIIQDAASSYQFASRIRGARFQSGEGAIIDSAPYSVRYAKRFGIKPFYAGEPTIAKDAECSFYYAFEVLEAPFPAGEPAIASSAEHSYWYAFFYFGKETFPSRRTQYRQ